MDNSNQKEELYGGGNTPQWLIDTGCLESREIYRSLAPGGHTDKLRREFLLAVDVSPPVKELRMVGIDQMKQVAQQSLAHDELSHLTTEY